MRHSAKRISRCSFVVSKAFGESGGNNPMLLHFLSILVKNNVIPVPSKGDTFTLYEIFSLLVRFLLKNEGEENFVKKYGKMAFKSLNRGRAYVKTKKEASDREASVLLPSLNLGPTFPHVTLHIFFAALYFVLALGEKEIEDLMRSDSNNPVFMANSLFLYFCLQLLTGHQIFPFLNKRKVVLKKLRKYVLTMINVAQLDMTDFSISCPALFNLADDKDEKAQNLLNKVLSICSRIEMLYLRPGHLTDLFLRHTFPNINSVSLSNNYHNVESDRTQNELIFVLINLEKSNVKKVLSYVKKSGRLHSIFFIGKDKSEKMLNISTFSSESVTKLHFSQENILCHILVEEEIPQCVSLTHLTLKSLSLQIPGETLEALPNAVKNGHLLKLSHLSLLSLDTLKLEVLFHVKWSELSCLDVDQAFDLNLLLLSDESKFPKLGHLSVRYFCCDDSVEPQVQKVLSTLRSLRFSRPYQNDALGEKMTNDGSELTLHNPSVSLNDVLDPVKLPTLRKLALQNHRISKDILEKNEFLPKQTTLDLSQCDLSSKLSYLLRRGLCKLESLILCKCNLRQVDFQCLAEASAKGKLENLRYLDVSHNRYHHDSFLGDLFSQECEWQKVTYLNVEFTQDQNNRENTAAFKFLTEKMQSG